MSGRGADSEDLIGSGLTRAAALRQAARLLAPVSGGEALLDARIFLEEATGLGRTDLLLAGHLPLGPEPAARLRALVARRLAGMPTWRVLGRREFWSLSFAVTPAVLDPRPDSESVVGAILDALAGRDDAPLRILDLGTGSGALLGALLHELANAIGWGIDLSFEACRVARGNLASLGLTDRALILNADWAGALASGQFDVVVSNPPYIETGTIAALDGAVREHDPHLALDGGPDGLTCYRAITADLSRLLTRGGLAALEVGAGQAAAVADLIATGGLRVTTVHRDLGGHDRTLLAVRD